MENELVYVSPKLLYPTESLESISNNRIHFYIECFRNNIEVESVQVTIFDDVYYILSGHHLMLAAVLENVEKINVDIKEFKDIAFWGDRQDFISTLESIGMRTLHDFECIGNFSYEAYPEYYSKK